MDECKPLPAGMAGALALAKTLLAERVEEPARAAKELAGMAAAGQGLILVHFSAQREHFCDMSWGALLVSVTNTA